MPGVATDYPALTVLQRIRRDAQRLTRPHNALLISQLCASQTEIAFTRDKALPVRQAVRVDIDLPGRGGAAIKIDIATAQGELTI